MSAVTNRRLEGPFNFEGGRGERIVDQRVRLSWLPPRVRKKGSHEATVSNGGKKEEKTQLEGSFA